MAPSRAPCPTEQSLPLTCLSGLFQVSGVQVHEEAQCRGLLSWAQPAQEEAKGVFPPFPAVPKSHNTCQTSSLHTKLQFGSFWVGKAFLFPGEIFSMCMQWVWQKDIGIHASSSSGPDPSVEFGWIQGDQRKEVLGLECPDIESFVWVPDWILTHFTFYHSISSHLLQSK